MHYLYTTFIYNPLYNGFVLLIDGLRSVSWIDAGIIVILFTLIVRLILFPISKKAARTQVMMRLIEPELASIKEKYKDDKQALALHTMELYKKSNINPFSSFILLFIQLPILFALYHIFYTSGNPTAPGNILYSFVPVPPALGTHFLGIFDLTKSSVVLALVAAVAQFLVAHITAPPVRRNSDGTLSQESTMHMFTKFFMPVLIFLFGLKVISALAIYWTTSNLFMIGQELYIRKQLAREQAANAQMKKA